MISIDHDPRRRTVLLVGGGLLLSAALPLWAKAATEIEITMAGSPSGSHVWFQPRGLVVQLGQVVRWVNRDIANVHTVTAYHPDNNKPLRIPKGVPSWNSGYLMPNESFVMVFDRPGVYDYFCIPHEQAGMVARIVVGDVSTVEQPYPLTDKQLPPAAQAAFPAISEIIEKGLVN